MPKDTTVPTEIKSILAKLGISQQSIHRIRFGGVVGKQALVCSVALIGLVVMAWKADSSMLKWGCLLAITTIAIFGMGAIGFHGHKHPVEATLEGGEVLAWKHIEQAIASKGAEHIVGSPGIPEGIGKRSLDAHREGERN